ncbi:MAG: NAD-dependent epimerase/dehydratase family protein, partial [Nanoarchaeota archaeon]|nr:NAD-dependent epimerase/dehydratase family protein [Nanoarchaeota archaeon]
NFSTCEIYGAEEFRVAEDSPASIGPVGYSRWVYAASKLAGEHMAKAFHTQYDLPTVTVRPFNVYGPGQVGDSAMKTFISNAIAGETLVIKGGGEQVRCWCYIDDFVDGLMPLIFDDRAVGETFNIGDEQAGAEIGELAQMIVNLTGSKSKIEYDNSGPADILYRVPSIRKMAEMFGYSPKVSLQEGIKRTEEWIRNGKS